MEDDKKKKKSIFSRIISLFRYFFIFLFPSLKLLTLNKFLSKGYNIEKDKWFVKQKQRNIILSITLILPLLLTMYKTYTIIDNDINLKTRISKIEDKSLIEKVKLVPTLVKIEKSDSLAIKEVKFETQARLLASFIILFLGLSTQLILVILIMKYHPLITETNKLKDLLFDNVLKKENMDKTIVFATPIGFLIDITGFTPEDIVRQKSIWDALNLTVKDYIKDSEKKSLVFFRKEFELQDTYMYESL